VDLKLSFRGLALRDAIEAMGPTGVIEVIVTLVEVAVVFDRHELTHGAVEDLVKRALEQVAERKTLASRRFEIPVWYDDPWSDDAARAVGVGNNIAFIAAQNGVSVDELIEKHASCDYLVTAVGFTPGEQMEYPLDSAAALIAPKYDTPRTHTPARAVAVASGATCIYPIASPGGYQLLGRSAVAVYDPHPKSTAFGPEGVLFRPGDRIHFRPIGPREYDEIWESYLRGAYEYQATVSELSLDDLL
jgi:urea carboxylase